MSIKINLLSSQVCCAAAALLLLAACNVRKEETPVIPPLSSPLSQAYIGFGVINVSYTRITAGTEEDNPDDNVSPGYLRRGSVVRIHERRLAKNADKVESWVLVEDASFAQGAGRQSDSHRGWLRESLVDIYDNEAQAITASEAMGR